MRLSVNGTAAPTRDHLRRSTRCAATWRLRSRSRCSSQRRSGVASALAHGTCCAVAGRAAGPRGARSRTPLQPSSQQRRQACQTGTQPVAHVRPCTQQAGAALAPRCHPHRQTCDACERISATFCTQGCARLCVPCGLKAADYTRLPRRTIEGSTGDGAGIGGMQVLWHEHAAACRSGCRRGGLPPGASCWQPIIQSGIGLPCTRLRALCRLRRGASTGVQRSGS